MIIIIPTLKKEPKAAESVWKRPPERFAINAFEVERSVSMEKLFERVFTISFAPEKA